MFLKLFLIIALISYPVSAYAAACDLTDTCCDASSTRDELESWTHNCGGRNEPPPFLGACTLRSLKHTIVLQINTGSWVNMSSATQIQCTTCSLTGVMSIPCSKNTAFTLTAKAGSGGSSYNCRTKHTKGFNIRYCYFTVTVNAPPAAGSQVIGGDIIQ